MKSSVSEKKEFRFGSYVYPYDLIRHERKTLSLTVMPDLLICVKCPTRADENRVELFLRKKWFWLEKQLTFFGKYKNRKYEREYISGESVYYLGRQYQLVVKQGSADRVVLSRGVLLVSTTKLVTNKAFTKYLISSWLDGRMLIVFKERLAIAAENFGFKNSPVFDIRSMKLRWGSCVRRKKIILNSKLVHVSKDCIDYVITHEFCHTRHKNHDKSFYKLLDIKFPKWKETKEKLELMGSLIQQ